MEEWFEENPQWNLGIISGGASGVCIVDCDTRHGGLDSLNKLGLSPSGATVVTGGGGYHYYYRLPDSPVRNSAGSLGAGIDIRGEGGYVVVPPSHFPDGKPYRWVGGRPPECLPEAPDWLVTPSKRRGHTVGRRGLFQGLRGDPDGWGIDMSPAPEGERNVRAASIAGGLVALRLPESHCQEILEIWNSRNNPPLPQEELNVTLASIIETDKRNHSMA